MNFVINLFFENNLDLRKMNIWISILNIFTEDSNLNMSYSLIPLNFYIIAKFLLGLLGLSFPISRCNFNFIYKNNIKI